MRQVASMQSEMAACEPRAARKVTPSTAASIASQYKATRKMERDIVRILSWVMR